MRYYHFRVELTDEEWWRLTEIADREVRDPKQQAAYFVKQAIRADLERYPPNPESETVVD